MAFALYMTYEQQHQDQNFVSRDFSLEMRKTTKVSKAFPSDFASDYALEITGDSEGFQGQRKTRPLVKSSSVGFGASGRIELEKSGSYGGGYGGFSRNDVDATASEDSCTPKRKSISLMSKNDGFNVPVQVYAVSVMSRSERRELGKRLKVELEQVRSMNRKIECGVINAVAVSSSSDLPSFSSGQKNSRSENGRVNDSNHVKPLSIQIPFPGTLNSRDINKDNSKDNSQDKRTPKANQLYVSSEFVSGKNKAPQVEKPKFKGALVGVKRGIMGRFESRDEKKLREDLPVQQIKPDVMIMKQCGTLLRRLMLHKFGWVFNTPVDIVKLNIPDYFKVIKKPMDLGTIKKKLETDVYLDAREFAADVRLTFANAMKYNPPGNDVHIMAAQLNKNFEDKWRAIGSKLPQVDSDGFLPKGVQPIAAIQQQQQQFQSKVADKPKQNNQPKPASISVELTQKSVPCKRPMSIEEKQMLSRDLESLPGDMPEQIIDFLRKHSSGLSQNEYEIEVDIDAFDNETLFELRKIVSDCLNEGNQNAVKNQPKVEPREAEAEPANGSRPGSSSSPLYTQKGGDPVDEDVDIGDNDLPASNFPPVEIEKDTAGRSSKCSSSSSSSSDSGSSSTDSDSASSSGSESDVDKVPSPDAGHKEQMCSLAIYHQRTSPSLETNGAKRAVSELDEENANSKPIPANVTDPCQEGESAPSERQVSPDKLYRAAFLRNRFVDTILKAQEKTLSQGDRGDPEKLRREREELERRQREEKARLQAEAKAAESARMQAEAEAAAEAKRKLEIEREAARLALQQMEKTVEIDENTQVLKDLEMLRSSQLDHIPSSGDETSPVRSQDELAPFPLQGRNPLEQLGLFMKMEDEEEEEATAGGIAAGNGGAEEGEID